MPQSSKEQRMLRGMRAGGGELRQGRYKVLPREERPVPPASPGQAAQLSFPCRHCEREHDKRLQQEDVSSELLDP